MTLRGDVDLRTDDRIVWHRNRLRVRRVIADPRTPDRLVAETEEDL